MRLSPLSVQTYSQLWSSQLPLPQRGDDHERR
jgi:hypothetical protein